MHHFLNSVGFKNLKKQEDLDQLLQSIVSSPTSHMVAVDSEGNEYAEFVKEYEAIQPELDVIRAIVDARTSQNMTQKELAERTGINQADISKLENGTRNPSVNLLKRLAEGLGMALKIEFVPKQRI